MAEKRRVPQEHLGPLLVIVIVGAVIVVGIIAAFLLAGWDKPLVVVMAFITLTSNGISLLIPSPLTKLQQSVTVANSPNDPVPTTVSADSDPAGSTT